MKISLTFSIAFCSYFPHHSMENALIFSLAFISIVSPPIFRVIQIEENDFS